MIPASVLRAFGVTDDPVRLPGGQGTTWQAQLVHGDLAGNVLFAAGEPPAVIDFSISCSPARRIHLMTVGEAEQVLAGEPGSTARWAPGYPTVGDVIAARRFLGACASTGDPQPFGNYEIRRREDGQAIGDVGFHGPADENGSVTIGFGLIPSARGKGYASEALRGLLLFARGHRVTCVKGDADHDNIASQHVMMAVGMRPAGEDERVRYFEIAWTDATAAGPAKLRLKPKLSGDQRSALGTWRSQTMSKISSVLPLNQIWSS